MGIRFHFLSNSKYNCVQSAIKYSSMRTVVKLFIFLGSLFGSIVLPIVLNVAGVIGLGTAIGLFLLLFSMLLVFGGGYGLLKLLKMRSPTQKSWGSNMPSNDSHGSLLRDINDELMSMEGNDPIKTFRGEELTTEQQIIPNMDQEQKTFIGIVAPKKNSKQIVNIIYSPDAETARGSPIWRYDDDPSPARRSDPLHDFKPYGGRGTFRPQQREQGQRKGGININLDQQNQDLEDEYSEF